jgi:adenylylsulfate kinase
MKKLILVFGLPGAGKTSFAKKLNDVIPNSCHINADDVRAKYNDWDFSEEGRLRQAYRMRDLADSSNEEVVILDFVCPKKMYRDIVDADIMFFVDRIATSRFADTNSIFEQPIDEDVVRIK